MAISLVASPIENSEHKRGMRIGARKSMAILAISIKRRKPFYLMVLALMLCGFNSMLQAKSITVPKYPGQALTMLSDGQILATGGLDQSGTAISNSYLIGMNGNATKLSAGLLEARAGHSATALPDGTVLIFGGTDGHGHYLKSMEIYDPTTSRFSLWPGSLLVPRTSHTATALTDGRVLIIGGTEQGGFPDDNQLLDFRTGNVQTVKVTPLYPRQGHSANLLSDGRILISGGTNINGSPVKQDEVYDPEIETFSAVQTDVQESTDDLPLNVADSIPLDGAEQYPIQDLLKIRFTQLINVTTATAHTISLSASDGSIVATTVAAAERGRLAFVMPSQPLIPGANYTLIIDGVTDLKGNLIPYTAIRFQTADDVDTGAEDGWTPDASALAGNWGSRTPQSSWQQLPPLKASSGVTALTGQVLGLSGRPLANVTLQIEDHQVKSDNTGRFLLAGVSPGHQVLVIDGRTAQKKDATYGLFEAGVDIQPGITNVLNYTIWMTRLDTAHAVQIPSPTTAKDTVITTPQLPGLELHLPANTVIVDHEGKPITELTITAIPLDKPPFPLPTGVRVPIYFTIQPGGSEIEVNNPGSGLKGAQLYYPNTYNEAAGTVYNFWNYDAASKGWYIYGNGRVTADKQHIVPDPGVLVYELTGAMVGGGSAKNGIGANPGGGPGNLGGEPVDLSTGQFIYKKTDLLVRDTIPIQLIRTYTTNDHYQRSFGIGSTSNYDIFMVGDVSPYTYQELIQPDGSAIRFNRTSSGTGYTDAVYTSTSSEGAWYGATIYWNQSTIPGASWILKTRAGMLYGFPDSYAKNDQVHQALLGIQDNYSNQVLLTRDSNAILTKITSPNGRFISLSHDPLNRITQATDNAGRVVSYTYDSGGRLATVTDVNGGLTTFTYNSNDQMTTITDPRNITYLTNQYDSYGRIIQQTQADESTYKFAWTPSTNVVQQWTSSGPTINRYDPSAYEGYTALISQVSVTGPRGYVREVTYNNLGMKTMDILASGPPEQQVNQYQYYADNLLESATDTLGRTSTFDYDAIGNLARVTNLAGTSNAVTYTATYDPTYSHILSFTDPLNHTSTFTYNSHGSLLQTGDPLGHGVGLTYDNFGHVASLTDAAGDTTTFGYTGGNLTTVVDALNNQTVFFPDQLGRVIVKTDPMGNSTHYQYDNAGQLTSVTNAQGNQAAYVYDPNGDLLSVQDFLTHTTNYTYDSMDRRLTSTDPLNRTTTVTYDVGGYPVSQIDPKGQVTGSTYDGLGRLIFRGYGATSGSPTNYQSTISYQYDAGNRMTSATDSVSGVISRGYDGLNRLTSETTPQGSISYTYDAAGRRLTAQPSSGAAISYGYDAANRLTGITQGAAQVGFTYDSANRRSTLSLPNGVVVQYGYDLDSRVQSIAYSYGGTSIGNLAYAYDQAGRKTAVTGTLAQTGLPNTLGQATYDAANELTAWDGTPLTYDADGNMTSGLYSQQYTWDARNQLASLNGLSAASFSYDAFGRRIGETIAGTTTGFQYDGANRIAETSAGATATILPGAIDEFFQRTDSTGTSVPLADAMRSTLGMTNASGELTTTYTYDPYGGTTIASGGSNNTSEYTGRENDGTGLYYYRARYYNPQMGRFISQDPIGYAGGINVYAYVGDNPTSFIDPFGMDRNSPGNPNDGNNPNCSPSGSQPSPPSTAPPPPGGTSGDDPTGLSPLFEVNENVEAFITTRLLVPTVMIGSGLTVGVVGVIATVGVCSTVWSCPAAVVTIPVAVAGFGLAAEGLDYGLTQHMFDPTNPFGPPVSPSGPTNPSGPSTDKGCS